MASQTAACIRFMTEMVEVAKKPPEQWTDGFATLNQQVPNLPALARLLVPAMDKVAQAVQHSYAQLRCAIVMIAAERFRKKNNRWPESLEELKKSGLLAEIPTDPFIGGPLKWKRTDDGVVVYAVGPDQADDGGKLDRNNPIKTGTDSATNCGTWPSAGSRPHRRRNWMTILDRREFATEVVRKLRDAGRRPCSPAAACAINCSAWNRTTSMWRPTLGPTRCRRSSADGLASARVSASSRFSARSR